MGSFSDNAIQRIILKKETLTNKQKQFCDHVVENTNEVATLTIKDLADQSNVGTTTVMRTIKRLGYQGFTEFKKAIHKASVDQRPSIWWPVDNQSTSTQIDHSLSNLWNEILMSLDQTYTDNIIKDIEATIELMKESSRINVLGLRSSKIPATYFASSMLEYTNKVNQLSNEVEFLYDRILQMKKDEIIFIFVQSPFATETLKAAEYCHKLGIKIVLVTDLLSCPTASIAEITLKVETPKKQYSIVANVALVELLIIEFAYVLLPDSKNNLENLGEVLVEEGVMKSFKGISHP